MSIFDKIFNTQPAAPAPVPSGQGNIPAKSNVATNPADPNQPAVPPVTNEIQSPLDQYKDLWQNAPNPTGDGQPNQPTELTTEQVQKVVSKADFAKNLDPNLLAAITAGGEGAAAAFTQAMNAVAQQVMTQSTVVNNQLSQKAIKEAIAAAEAKVPALLRDQSSADHLRTTNPLFDNPAVKPVIDATRSQLLQKFPNATNAELTDMTNKYIMAMGTAFAPPKIDPAAANETDWSKFLGG